MQQLNFPSQQLSVSQIDYQLQYFKRFMAWLANKPWSFCLDSAKDTGSNHPNARYDIWVWQPDLTLTTQKQTTKVYNPHTKEEIANETGDPLAILQHWQTQYFKQIQIENIENIDLPFIGGALGYFSYDLGRYFEKLPQVSKDDINLPDMLVGIFTRVLVIDHQLQNAFLVCPSEEKQHWLQHLQQTQYTEKPAQFKLMSNWQSNTTKAEYLQKFKQIKDYLLSGDCYQINLTHRFQAQYQGDEFQAYQALREQNKAPFSAFMRLSDHCILSVSPERFLQLHHGKVETKPIKGTLPRGNNLSADQQNATKLQQSTKDRAENLMIVDLLRNDISRVCKAGSVKVPKLFEIESFSSVHHLVSTVIGELKADKTACDLLRACFPGGSITGAPKIHAMEIIEQLENNKRSLYCGSIGYISQNGNMDSSITIRTVVAKNQQLYCWAGGGIVADSQAEMEYQETFDKVNKILPVLANLNQDDM